MIRALIAALTIVVTVSAGVAGDATTTTRPATAATAPATATATVEEIPITFEYVAALDDLTDDHARIFRLYWAYFDRRPDPAGALFWVDRYEQCWDLHRIAAFFTTSPEFRTTYGPIGDAEFVDLVYGNVLGRAPDPAGRSYWLSRLNEGSITRTRLMLDFAWSDEFVGSHPLPSDGVPGRGCRSPTVGAPFQSYGLQAWIPYATVGPVVLHHPASATAHIGFHESNRGGGLQQQPLAAVTPMTTMSSRNRGTPSRSAADVVVHPLVEIRSPVTGTVLRSGNYTLYCRYVDGFAVIRPDAQPFLEVGVLHLRGVRVQPGARVEAGRTVIAEAAALLPFSSQVDGFTATPWPHVHIEVVDPSVPNRPRSTRC